MIREEMKKIPMDRKALRNFGLLMACVLLIAGCWLWWKSAPTGPGMIAAALLLSVMSLAAPAILKPIYRIWMIFALILGWVMTRVILTLVYYLVLTPIGLAGRVFGKQFLQLKRSKESATYWVRREGPAREKNDYERQF